MRVAGFEGISASTLNETERTILEDTHATSKPAAFPPRETADVPPTVRRRPPLRGRLHVFVRRREADHKGRRQPPAGRGRRSRFDRSGHAAGPGTDPGRG